MANNLGVSLAKLEETAVILREQKSAMAAKLNNISNAIEQVDSVIQSDATKNMRTTAAKMADRFSEIEKEVEGFAVFLDGIIKNYELADDSAGEQLNSLNNQFS